MAPEIKERKVYDGRKSDIFSLGVILFISVLGLFPFGEAKKDDFYYNILLEGNINKYWDKFNKKHHLSDDFKNLII